MPAPTPNPRGAEFWNSTMGHSWVSHQAAISNVFTSVTSVSLDAAAAKPGEHVIDIGCGTGDTLLEFAKIVGPSGSVLGVDVSVPMLGFAKRRAAEAALGNVTCALADATSHAFEPHWADLVYSRFGVMFFDEPIKAFTNIRSGMKAGGRLVFVCFRSMPESPWFRLPIEAARPHVPPQPPVDPTAPGMFSLAREDRLRRPLDAVVCVEHVHRDANGTALVGQRAADLVEGAALGRRERRRRPLDGDARTQWHDIRLRRRCGIGLVEQRLLEIGFFGRRILGRKIFGRKIFRGRGDGDGGSLRRGIVRRGEST